MDAKRNKFFPTNWIYINMDIYRIFFFAQKKQFLLLTEYYINNDIQKKKKSVTNWIIYSYVYLEDLKNNFLVTNWILY